MTDFNAEQVYNEAIRQGHADPLSALIFTALGAGSAAHQSADPDGIILVGDSLTEFLRSQLGDNDKAEVYRDIAGKYRYRIIAANGRVVDAADEGYSTRFSATRAARRGRKGIPVKQIRR